MTAGTISTIEEIVRWHARERPDAPMTTFDGVTATFGEMNARSSRVAHGLRALGVAADARVAILCKSGPACFETLFGARKAGAVQVALNWRLAPDELAFILGDSGAEVLFVDPVFADVAAAIVTSRVRKVIVLGEAYEAWLAEHSDADTGHVSRPEDVALQLYTSGTTGRPKGAMLMNRSVFAFIDAARGALGFYPDGVHLNTTPLFHVGGINWSLQAFAQGAHVIAFREFDAAVLVREIERSRVTHVMTVPAIIQLLLAQPAARTTDFSSLKVIVYGGSTIPEKVLRDAIATFGPVLHGMYGSTELSFGATVLTPAEHVDPEHPEWLRSCGRVLSGAEIRVVDPHTLVDVGEGETGEIWFRTRQIGKGYWNRPEASAETFRSDGWYRSGDLGHQIGGYIFLSDRLHDMIISGGENIYPAEVERVLSEHPSVAEVVAFGVPDERWGEAVHVLVVRAPEIPAEEADLIAFAGERLARYKRPREVVFVENLPRTASGKVQREALRAPFWAGHSRRIA